MSSGSPSSKYSVELANPNGAVLVELSGRAKARQFTVIRNDADSIQWTIDLDEFEHYCRTSQQDPRLALISNYTEVRIKRLGTYLAAGQLNYKDGEISADTGGNTVELRAAGFLNLFTTRYTSSNAAGLLISADDQVYTSEDASAIAWDLINTSQQGLNDPTGQTTPGYWNYGVTQGTLATVGLHNRDYQNMAIKDALQDLCNAPAGSFDMKFDYLKRFNTYAQMGVQRPDVIFEYPGNIQRVSVIEDGTQLANYIVAQGTGNGSVTLQDFEAFSEASGAGNFYRQLYVTPSSLQTSDDSLQDYANWNLAQYQVPFVLPTIQVDGNRAPFVTDYEVGDWVRIIIRNHPLYRDINGMYRVEQLQVSVDDNDNETAQITTSLT